MWISTTSIPRMDQSPSEWQVRWSTPGLSPPREAGGRLNPGLVPGAKQEGFPRSVRMTFGGARDHLLNAGANALSVPRLAGQKDSRTTMLYNRRGKLAKSQQLSFCTCYSLIER